MKKATAAFFITLLLTCACAQADWRDLLGLGRKTNQVSTASVPLNSLSQDQVAQALKEALGQGVQSAVSQLGREGGFLTNANVKIPMPQQLRKVESTLRALKQERLADEFVVTMNRAAEQAVPAATTVFSEAVKQITVEDAKGILTGGEDAATQYFRRTTSTNLHSKFLPIVQTATAKAGVTQAYKQLTTSAKQNKFLGTLGSAYLEAESMDLDRYVTDRALDGLFKMIAEQEKLIRANPVARTSALLQKVFGAVPPAGK